MVSGLKSHSHETGARCNQGRLISSFQLTEEFKLHCHWVKSYTIIQLQEARA